MTKTLNLRLATLALAVIALPQTALAYDFGFVRAPDWMDPYALGLGLLTATLMAFSAFTKPGEVPMSALYRTRLSGIANFAFKSFQVVGTLFIALILVGMFLARI
jgi:hypothetical protein